MSNAINSAGVKLRRWNGANWVDIAEILSIGGPRKTRDTIDVTSLDATSGYREFIAGFKDGGTVPLSMNFTRATYEIMNDDYEDGDLHNYEILIPDTEATSLEFEGAVTEIGIDFAVGAQIKSDVVIKISNPVVTNSGSGSSA